MISMPIVFILAIMFIFWSVDDDLDGDKLLLLLLSTSSTQLQHIPLQTAQLCLKSWSLAIFSFSRFSFSSQPISSEAKNFPLTTKWLVRPVRCWKQTFKLSSSQSLFTRQLAAYPLDHYHSTKFTFIFCSKPFRKNVVSRKSHTFVNEELQKSSYCVKIVLLHQ